MNLLIRKYENTSNFTFYINFKEDIMVARKSIDGEFKFGWYNGKSNLSINQKPNGAFVKVNDEYLSFDIDLDKENMIYRITHFMYFKFPCGGVYANIDVGTYDTFTGEKIKCREYGINRVIEDWFVAMYCTDEYAKNYLGENYECLNEKCIKDYKERYAESNRITTQTAENFRKQFCLD